MIRIKFSFAAFTVALMLSTISFAADGKLEINQACVAVGCFAGDSPGFPVTISAAGSYVLTSNILNPTDDSNGILIQADHVTLDLSGFEISGNATAPYGVRMEGNFVEIRDGVVRGFGFAGIASPFSTTGQSSSVIRVRVSGIGGIGGGGIGIFLEKQAMILDCIVVENAGSAIQVGNHSTVRGNLVVGNEGNGISGGTSMVVTDNVVRDAGTFGISVAAASVVSGNTVSFGTGFGIHVEGRGSVISGNTSHSNQKSGICPTAQGASCVVDDANHGDSLLRHNVAVNNNLSGMSFANIEPCASCTLIENHAP